MCNPPDDSKPPRKRPLRTELSFLLTTERSPEKRARPNPPISQASVTGVPQASSSTAPPNNGVLHPTASATPSDHSPVQLPPQHPLQRSIAQASPASRLPEQAEPESDEEEADEIQPNSPRPTATTPKQNGSTSSPRMAPGPLVIRNIVPCDECSMRFCNEQAVQRHKRLQHPSGKRNPTPVECSECKLILKSQQNLNRHAKVHGPGARLKCSECEAAFTTGRSRTSHMREFHGLKGAQRSPSQVSMLCPSVGCGYSSNQKTNVDRHYNSIHLGIRNFRCSICGYRASTRANLDAHVIRHKRKGKGDEEEEEEDGDGTDRDDGRASDTESEDGTDTEEDDVGLPNLLVL